MSESTKTYELANDQGCHCDEIKAASFKDAKAYFERNWTGEYKIICGESNEEWKVNLD